MTPSFPAAPLFSVQAENHLADSPPPTFPEHYARNLGRTKPQKVKPTCLGQVGVQSGPHRVEGTLHRREGVIDPDRYDEKGSSEENGLHQARLEMTSEAFQSRGNSSTFTLSIRYLGNLTAQLRTLGNLPLPTYCTRSNCRETLPGPSAVTQGSHQVITV